MKLFLALIFLSGFIYQCQAQYLDQYLWKNRVIIIYDNSDIISQKAILQEQKLLHDIASLKERKIRVLRYNGQTVKSLYPVLSEEVNTDIGITFSSDYECLLIGLDGSVKERFSDIKSAEWFSSVIDGMPMRKSELRKKKKN